MSESELCCYCRCPIDTGYSHNGCIASMGARAEAAEQERDALQKRLSGFELWGYRTFTDVAEKVAGLYNERDALAARLDTARMLVLAMHETITREGHDHGDDLDYWHACAQKALQAERARLAALPGRIRALRPENEYGRNREDVMREAAARLVEEEVMPTESVTWMAREEVRGVERFCQAFDAWATSPDHIGGQLFDAMLEAREAISHFGHSFLPGAAGTTPGYRGPGQQKGAAEPTVMLPLAVVDRALVAFNEAKSYLPVKLRAAVLAAGDALAEARRVSPQYGWEEKGAAASVSSTSPMAASGGRSGDAPSTVDANPGESSQARGSKPSADGPEPPPPDVRAVEALARHLYGVLDASFGPADHLSVWDHATPPARAGWLAIARSVEARVRRAAEEERAACLLLAENDPAGGMYAGGGDWGDGANTAKRNIAAAIRARSLQ